MKKGEKAREKILDTAIEVFKSKRFGNGSIREIASRVGIKNSTVYYYFKNKEEIYKGLVKTFKEGLCHKVQADASMKDKPINKIKKIVSKYVDFVNENINLYDIFREIEFVDLAFAREYYEELTNCIEEAYKDDLKDGFDSKSIAFAILGSIYFVVIKNLLWNSKENVDEELKTVLKVIENGIDNIGDFKPYVVKEKKHIKIEPRFNTRGEKTKKTILKTAEKLFGEIGYQRAQIADISRLSETGLGTFYIYFKSKKEVLSEVIKLVNHALRSNSWDYTKGFKDRREIENAGIQAFFHQFKNMGKDYRIVREAEFVDKTIGTWYYTRIASSYAKGLEEGIRSGAIIDVDSETLAYILMGISHTVGIDWFVLNENKTLSKNSVLSVLEFIMHGLKGILKEE